MQQTRGTKLIFLILLTILSLVMATTALAQDFDGDGWDDELDDCPEVFGDNFGCPSEQVDSDGDGIFDDFDYCPFEGDFGNGVDELGCPFPVDSDFDGYTDDVDSCPGRGDEGFGVDEFGCPILDIDFDGYLDNVDACPNRGDEGFGVDGTGCPNIPDSDFDGFPNDDDFCPARGDEGYGVDGTGCPNPPPDSDFDGLPDSDDNCPNRGDEGYGIDGLGCPNPAPAATPVPDSDNDGFPDDTDVCPTEGDQGFGLDDVGCPMARGAGDTDDDGLLDPEDACPNQAGPASNNGCPLPSDRDGDGFADEFDQCPDEGDRGEGVDNRGCPIGLADTTTYPIIPLPEAGIDLPTVFGECALLIPEIESVLPLHVIYDMADSENPCAEAERELGDIAFGTPPLGDVLEPGTLDETAAECPQDMPYLINLLDFSFTNDTEAFNQLITLDRLDCNATGDPSNDDSNIGTSESGLTAGAAPNPVADIVVQVWDDSSFNGQLDAGEDTFDALIRYQREGGEEQAYRLHDSGVGTIDVDQPGTYTVWVDNLHPNGIYGAAPQYIAINSMSVQVTVDIDGTNQSAFFPMRKLEEVAGKSIYKVTLFEDANSNGRFDDGDSPLDNVGVNLIPEDASLFQHGAATNRDGQLAFVEVEPGTYDLSISTDLGNRTPRFTLPMKVTIEPNKTQGITIPFLASNDTFAGNALGSVGVRFILDLDKNWNFDADQDEIVGGIFYEIRYEGNAFAGGSSAARSRDVVYEDYTETGIYSVHVKPEYIKATGWELRQELPLEQELTNGQYTFDVFLQIPDPNNAGSGDEITITVGMWEELDGKLGQRADNEQWIDGIPYEILRDGQVYADNVTVAGSTEVKVPATGTYSVQYDRSGFSANLAPLSADCTPGEDCSAVLAAKPLPGTGNANNQDVTIWVGVWGDDNSDGRLNGNESWLQVPYTITKDGQSVDNGITPSFSSGQILNTGDGVYMIEYDTAALNAAGYHSVINDCGAVQAGGTCDIVVGALPIAPNKGAQDITILLGIYGDDDNDFQQDANEPWMNGIGYDITLNGTSIANGQTIAGVDTIVLPGASSGQYEVILDAAEINRRGYLSVNGACGLLNPGDLCNQVGGLTPLAVAPNNQPGSDIQILIGLFGDDNRNNTQDANEPWMDGINYDIMKDGANIGSGTTINGVDTLLMQGSGQYEIVFDKTEINNRGYLSVEGNCGLLPDGGLCNLVSMLIPMAAAPGNAGDANIITVGVWADDIVNYFKDPNESWLDGIAYVITDTQDGSQVDTGSTINGILQVAMPKGGVYAVDYDTTAQVGVSTGLQCGVFNNICDATVPLDIAGANNNRNQGITVKIGVFGDDNGNGVQDPNETYLLGADYLLILGGVQLDTGSTVAPEATFTYIPPGHYEVVYLVAPLGYQEAVLDCGNLKDGDTCNAVVGVVPQTNNPGQPGGPNVGNLPGVGNNNNPGNQGNQGQSGSPNVGNLPGVNNTNQGTQSQPSAPSPTNDVVTGLRVNFGANFRDLVAAFMMTENGNSDIYLLVNNQANPLIETANINESYPAVDPNGERVMYIAEDENGVRSLWLIDIASKQQQMLYEDNDATHLASYRPAWHPDGKSIYVTLNNQTGIALYQFELEADDIVPILVMEDVQSPSIASNGRYIAFERVTNEVSNIYTMTLANRQVRQITNANPGEGCQLPEFSRDPLILYFVCTTPGGEKLHQYGVSGIQTVDTPTQLVRGIAPGPAEGFIAFDDETDIYFGSVDGKTPMVTLIDGDANQWFTQMSWNAFSQDTLIASN